MDDVGAPGGVIHAFASLNETHRSVDIEFGFIKFPWLGGIAPQRGGRCTSRIALIRLGPA